MSWRTATPALRGAIVMRRIVAPIAVAITLLGSAAQAPAQPACPAPSLRIAARQWPAPLDREVTLEANTVTLRDGLTRLASAARVRLSYVAELLPLDRQFCLAYRSVAAGDVLSDLLRGTELEPVVAGDDQVVLAPARHSASVGVPADDVSPQRASVLDRVVVMGTSADLPERSSAISVDVVGGDKQIGRASCRERV